MAKIYNLERKKIIAHSGATITLQKMRVKCTLYEDGLHWLIFLDGRYGIRFREESSIMYDTVFFPVFRIMKNRILTKPDNFFSTTTIFSDFKMLEALERHYSTKGTSTYDILNNIESYS